MTTIAHLSDTHFGTIDEPVREAILRDLHAHPVSLIIITGDITQRARSWQFRDARAFMDALPAVPRLVIPGNHDIPLYDFITRFTRPYRLYRRFISTDQTPTYLDDAVAVQCVDATRPTRHVNGVLSDQQITATASWLAEVKQPFRLVCTHQPLAVPITRDVHNLARGAETALSSWIAAGADLFLGGHIHLPYCMEVQSPAGERTAVVLQAGTAVSLRIRHGVPNSYNRIALKAVDGARAMCLERRDYDAATLSFATKRVYNAHCVAGRWVLEDTGEQTVAD